MREPPATREAIEQRLRLAFAGVTLGDGVSLGQARVIDNYGEGTTDEEFRQLPLSEVTDSWEAVPWSELESDNVAHLDPEGYRYYIPAFLLSVLQSYEAASMRVIGTLQSLYPSGQFEAYVMSRFNLLTYEQKQAIACYIDALPSLVDLDADDSKDMQEAQEHYWRQFLPIIQARVPHDN